MSIDIAFLGTASQAPSKTRNVSSLALRFSSGSVWMFDCGEGTQHQVVRQSMLKMSKVDAVFITHLHGDHSFGLPGLLCTMSASTDTEAGRVVHIVGPEGTGSYVRNSLDASHSRLVFKCVVHELVDDPAKASDAAVAPEPAAAGAGAGRGAAAGDGAVAAATDDIGEGAYSLSVEVVRIAPRPSEDGSGPVWDCFSAAEGTVVAAPVKHTVPCMGFVVQEPDAPGKMMMPFIKPALDRNRDALKAAGVPKAEMLLKDIKAGKVVHLPDGTELDPTDSRVIGPGKPGRKVCVLGDTCDSSAVAPLATEADVVVHEATNAKTADETSDASAVEAKAISHGHSTPQMAGRFARSIGAKRLVLTHFSARYSGDDKDESLATMREIAVMAAAALTTEGAGAGAGTGDEAASMAADDTTGYAAASDGRVVCAHDFLTIALKSKGGVIVDPRGAM